MIGILTYCREKLHLDLKKQGVNWFALSPFTREKTASFCVFESTNSYYDYSGSFGGDVVDLHKRLNHLDRKEAYIQLIKDDFSIGTFSQFSITKPEKKEPEKTFTILSINDIKDPALVNYAKSRFIPENILKANCFEIKYTIKKYTFNAICFHNDYEGVELRNSKFKGSFNKKGITTVQGQKETNTLDIFEGFLDYLSYLTMHNIEKPVNDSIILNSLSMKKQVIPEKHIQNIRLFLDNDEAGEKATKYFLTTFNFLNTSDQREHYKDFGDLNDYLKHRNNRKN